MITLPRVELAAELALLQSVISKYVTIPILDTIRFEAGDNLRLTASSIDVTLTSELPLPGLMNEPEAFCLPARPLAQLVTLFGGDGDVTLKQVDNGRMMVRWGRAKHLLPMLPATEFPDVERANAETVAIDGDLWAAMLKHVAFAVMPPTDGVRQSDQKFTGLHLTLEDGKLTIAATNKLRLAIATIQLDGPPFSVILPHQSLVALQKFSGEQIQLGVAGNFAVLKSGSRTLTMRLLDDKPLAWTTLFPAMYTHTAEIGVDELDAALRRALVTASERATFVVNGLKWTLSAGELLIESRDGDSGKSEELVVIDCPSLNGSSLSVGMNGAQVVDYLALVEGHTHSEFTPGANVVRLSPVVAKAFDYQYLVNTISLKW